MDLIKRWLGANIARQRKLKGYRSQESFSEASGVSVPTIANVERGENWPEELTMDKLIQTLNISEETLFQNPHPKDNEGPSLREVIEFLKALGSVPATRRDSALKLLRGEIKPIAKEKG